MVRRRGGWRGVGACWAYRSPQLRMRYFRICRPGQPTPHLRASQLLLAPPPHLRACNPLLALTPHLRASELLLVPGPRRGGPLSREPRRKLEGWRRCQRCADMLPRIRGWPKSSRAAGTRERAWVWRLSQIPLTCPRRADRLC